MGLAQSEELAGSYVQLPWPVTYYKESIEDGYVFLYIGKFCFLTMDNHGMITSRDGLLWSPDDGIMCTHVEKHYHSMHEYLLAEKL